jgi:hypothetical protein
MKLTIYNKKNSIISRSNQHPSISINQKGHIVFNKESISLIELKDGDLLELCQNEDEKTDFYLSKTDSQDGFKLTNKKSGKYDQFMIATGSAGKLMLVPYGCKRANFKISSEPEVIDGRKFYYIISASIFNKR